MAHLVNRTDRWGGYSDVGGQLTRRGELNTIILARHFAATRREAVIGLHTAGLDNLSLGGALDIDQHGDDDRRRVLNRAAAIHWYDRLVARGFRPLLYGSNGRGGYHLRILLAQAIDAARVYHLLRDLTADYQSLGLAHQPEQFPKQADVRACAKGLGNWLRIPGKHHSHDYWSVVWNGQHGLVGDAAINHILSLPGDDPAQVPDPPPAPPRSPSRGRSVFILRGGKCAGANRRIAAYMAALPHGGAGTGRDNTAFNFAAWLTNDLGLPDHVAIEWLCAWDNGNSPPKGRDRLEMILTNSRSYGRNRIGG
jgi:hypothetical protein